MGEESTARTRKQEEPGKGTRWGERVGPGIRVWSRSQGRLSRSPREDTDQKGLKELEGGRLAFTNVFLPIPHHPAVPPPESSGMCLRLQVSVCCKESSKWAGVWGATLLARVGPSEGRRHGRIWEHQTLRGPSGAFCCGLFSPPLSLWELPLYRFMRGQGHAISRATAFRPQLNWDPGTGVKSPGPGQEGGR